MTRERIITTILDDYISEVLARLPQDRQPGRVVPVTPGTAPAWDACCEGQLYGQVLEIIPAGDRAPVPGRFACAISGWVVSLALGMLRCAHTVDDRGRAPSAAAVDGDGREMLDDMRIIHDALASSKHTRSILSWTPLEVEGGCHGGEWRFTALVPIYPKIDVEEPTP